MKLIKHLIIAALLFSSAAFAADGASPYQQERTVRALSYPFPYSADRLQFHDRIIHSFTRGIRKQQNPKVIFFAGGYGTGKTYTLQKLQQMGLIEKTQMVVIDPDEIREQIPEYQNLKVLFPESPGTPVQTETLDIADVALEHSLRHRNNVVFESSMKDGEHFKKMFAYIRKVYPHYQLEIVHVKAPREQALAQAKLRSSKDGRMLPDQMILESIDASDETIHQLAGESDRVTEVNNVIGKDLEVSSKTFSHRLPSNTKHVIFDIDWTLVNPYHTVPPNDWRFVKVQGEIYRVTDHVGEIMKRLSSRENVRLSFFSGGTYSRNLELLKAIKPPELNGKSLYDLAYRILSKEDLKVIDPKAKFFDRKFQKDAHLVSLDLKDTALVDDSPGFLINSGAGKVSLGDAYDHFEKFEDISKVRPYPGNPKYRPSTRRAWRDSRDRLARAFGIVDEALDESVISKKTFRGLINEKDGVPGRHYLEEGLKKLNTPVRTLYYPGSNPLCVGPVLNSVP